MRDNPMSILPHDALAVDVYPDETPEVPLSAYFELEADPCVLLEAEEGWGSPESWPDWTDDGVWAVGPMPGVGPARCVCATCAEVEAPAPHAETCTCEVCYRALADRLGAEEAAERARLETAYPLVEDPVEPALALDEQVAIEARKYRHRDTLAADLIATELEALAYRVRAVGATCPQEYEARIEVLDRDIRDEWECIGYAEGLAAGRAECPRCGRLD
jgi:hypothetical protein